jgi:hypothetical protein
MRVTTVSTEPPASPGATYAPHMRVADVDCLTSALERSIKQRERLGWAQADLIEPVFEVRTWLKANKT